MYHNSTDERFGNSIWRWTYDYPVKGLKDISDLDDKIFVRKRRIRNRTVSLMYCNFFIGFVVTMSLLSNILIFTSGRSDFDLLLPVIKKIKKNKNLNLTLLVSGSHLSKKHGFTLGYIKKQNIKEIKIITLRKS